MISYRMNFNRVSRFKAIIHFQENRITQIIDQTTQTCIQVFIIALFIRENIIKENGTV